MFHPIPFVAIYLLLAGLVYIACFVFSRSGGRRSTSRFTARGLRSAIVASVLAIVLSLYPHEWIETCTYIHALITAGVFIPAFFPSAESKLQMDTPEPTKTVEPTGTSSLS